MSNLEIMWTKVDEAPGLATFSLLPIVEAFVATAGVKMKLKDISLTGRIIANFPEKLKPEQKINDELAELGKLAMKPEANIIKLPNISASIPQLKAAIKELQGKGYDGPRLSGQRRDDRRGQGNPRPLRQGAGQRRQSGAARGQLRPPRRRRRKGVCAQPSAQDGRVEQGLENPRGAYDGQRFLWFGSRDHRGGADRMPGSSLSEADGAATVLKAKMPLQAGEVIDCSVMNAKALRRVLRRRDRGGEEGRHPVLAARQDDHDEDLRSHPVRSLHIGVLRRRVQEAWRHA